MQGNATADEDEFNTVAAWLLGAVAVAAADLTYIPGFIDALMAEPHVALGGEIPGIEIMPVFTSGVLLHETGP